MFASALALTVLLASLAYWRHARGESSKRLLIAESGLPAELDDVQSHLDVLHLGRSVVSIDWVSHRLRFLKLRRRPRGSSAQWRGPSIPWTQSALKLEGLPPNLVGLDISDLAPSDPERVEEDALTTLVGLPPRLQYLDISYNDRLQSLNGLPGSLRSLSAIMRGLTEFSSLRSSSLACLDLGSPFLRSLRDQLPRELRSLTLRGTGVTTLEGLPDGLESLEVFNNSELAMADGFPRNLKSLRALSVDSAALPSLETLPRSLEDLHLSRTRLKKPADPRLRFFEALQALSLNAVQVQDWRSVVPEALQSLSLVGTSLPPKWPGSLRTLSYDASPPEREVALPTLPGTLEILRLSNVLVRNLRELPRQLTGLAITHATLDSIDGFPIGLKRLDLRAVRQLKTITLLPDHLVSLNLLACRDLTKITVLPNSLRFLNIADTGITTLPTLPAGLEELDISGTAISSLHGLPPSLRVLTLTAARFHSLDGLPSSVRELRFVDAPEDRAETSHFTCDAVVPHFERWPCLLPPRGDDRPPSSAWSETAKTQAQRSNLAPTPH
jgi:Leucine-rich repeat (LRR) protein